MQLDRFHFSSNFLDVIQGEGGDDSEGPRVTRKLNEEESGRASYTGKAATDSQGCWHYLECPGLLKSHFSLQFTVGYTWKSNVLVGYDFIHCQ